MPAAIQTTFERCLRPVRDMARGGTEALWRLAFEVAGSLRSGGIQRWSSPGGRRIIVVAPHPDDESIGCGGTLACHAAAGDDVLALFVTDGRRSRALGLSPDEMARRRKEEAARAASALGARMEWWGLPEGEWREDELRQRLREFLASAAPHVLYAPSRIDFHPEHVRTAWALGAVAEQSLPAGALVRIYSSQVPLTSILVNLVHDGVSEEAVARVLSAYVTQAATLKEGLRPGRYAAAFHGGRGRAEEFWELSPKAYAALHAGEPPVEPWKIFRGIRMEPWSDPLAYLVGRRARRRARERAAVEF